MALTISGKDVIDFGRYEELLSARGYIYVDREKFKNQVDRTKAESALATRHLMRKLRIYSKSTYRYVDGSGDNIAETLISLGVPPQRLTIWDSGAKKRRRSMDMERVIKPLILALENNQIEMRGRQQAALDLLYAYVAHKKLKSAHSLGVTKLKNFTPTDKFGSFNNPLDKITFRYNRRSTGRMYTEDDNVQGYHLNYVKSFAAENGKVLFWMDFAQIDLRVAQNLFMRSEENAHIFSAYSDKYEALTRVIYAKLNMTFDEVAFQSDRKKYKILALSLLYLASKETAGAKVGSTEVAELLEKFYERCEALADYKKTVQQYISEGSDIEVKDYFGVIRTIWSDTPNPMSVLINTPTQMTSASIMSSVSLKIYDKFLEHGYTPDQIDFFLNRHDEVIFMMDKELLKDSWIIEDYSQIYVDDWDELKLEYGVGDYYKEENPEYMAAVVASCEERELHDKFWRTQRFDTGIKAKDYFPVDEMIILVENPTLAWTETEFYTYVLSNICRPIEDLPKYPQFVGLYERYNAVSGNTYILNISRGVGYKLEGLLDPCDAAEKLKLNKLYVIDRLNEPSKSDTCKIITHQKDLYSQIELSEYLEGVFTKPKSFFKINTDFCLRYAN